MTEQLKRAAQSGQSAVLVCRCWVWLHAGAQLILLKRKKGMGWWTDGWMKDSEAWHAAVHEAAESLT